MRLLLAALLVPVAAASAQVTLTSDLSSPTSPQIYIGRAACKTQLINFRWNVGAGRPNLGEEIDLVRAHASSTCANASVSSPDTQAIAPSQAQIGTKSEAASGLIFSADQSDGGSFAGGCDNNDRKSSNPYTIYYCVQLKPSAGGNAPYASIPVNFATANPTPPGTPVIGPGDQHLRVDWTAGDPGEKISTYDVHVLAADAGLDLSKYADRVTTVTNADVQTTDDGVQLQNDVPYTVQLVATDSYGNVSAPSAAASGTPKRVLDFYNLYRDEGGSAGGGRGCSSAGAATWMGALALLVGLLARRRKRARGGTALFLLGLGTLLAPGARAEWRARERPARKLLIGFKIDRYDPKIDSEAAFAALPADQRPYHLIFRGRAPLRYQLEVDWEVAHPLGSLLLGATAGYWQNFGKGLTAITLQPSGDTALLDVIPFGLVATYRFDWLADRFQRFPVIPYAQLGLTRALWASFSGTGAVSRDATRGGRGSGWTWGYTTALGLAINLDSIDPELAREAYVDTGIQRTSLFAEYGWTHLDDFHGSGSPGTLILSDRAWRFGLSLEF